MTRLDQRLEEWVRAGAIAAEQADAIRRLEQERGPRIHPLAEAGAYLGAVVAAAAAIGLVSQFWDTLTITAQAGLLGAVTLVLLAAGAFIRGDDEGGASRRLVGFLWAAGTVTAVGAVAVLVMERESLDELWYGFLPGVAALVLGGGLWARHRQVLLLVVAWLGAVDVLGFGLGLLEVEALALSGAMWALGAVGGLLTWGGVLTPRRTGYSLAALTTLIASQTIIYDRRTLGLAVGLVTAGALVAAGARAREFVLVGFGVAGLAVFIPQTFDELGIGEVGAALGTLVVGVGVLVAALVAVRSGSRREVPR